MDSGNNKVFAFLHVINDEILATDPPSHLRIGLEHCFVACCLTYRLLLELETQLGSTSLQALLFASILKGQAENYCKFLRRLTCSQSKLM
jgi:hypothetical protein